MSGSDLRIPNFDQLIVQAPDIEPPPAPLRPVDDEIEPPPAPLKPEEADFEPPPAPLLVEDAIEPSPLCQLAPRRFATASRYTNSLACVADAAPRFQWARLFAKTPPVLFIPPLSEIPPYEPPPAGEKLVLNLPRPSEVPLYEPPPEGEEPEPVQPSRYKRVVASLPQPLSTPPLTPFIEAQIFGAGLDPTKPFPGGPLSHIVQVNGQNVAVIRGWSHHSQADYTDTENVNCGSMGRVKALDMRNWQNRVTDSLVKSFPPPGMSWKSFAKQALAKAGLRVRSIKLSDPTLHVALLRSISNGVPFFIQVSHNSEGEKSEHVLPGIGVSVENLNVIAYDEIGRQKQRGRFMIFDSNIGRHVPSVIVDNRLRILNKEDEKIPDELLAAFQKNHGHQPGKKRGDDHDAKCKAMIIKNREQNLSTANRYQVGYSLYQIMGFIIIEEDPTKRSKQAYRPLFASSR